MLTTRRHQGGLQRDHREAARRPGLIKLDLRGHGGEALISRLALLAGQYLDALTELPEIRGGFVHVPALDSLPAATAAEGLRALLTAAVHTTEDIEAPAGYTD